MSAEYAGMVFDSLVPDRPILLDVYCCQGGASAGYQTAGWDVLGIDKEPQPRYPFPFLQMDALEAMSRLIDGETLWFQMRSLSPIFGDARGIKLTNITGAHTSPPCQLYSITHRINKSDFPDLIGPTRELLEQTGLPYVIENVMEAAPELHDPVMLCGEMFGLETYRHRLFETNWGLESPTHPEHLAKNTKMGRRPVPGEYMHVVGNFSGVDKGREVMGMPWATRDGLREAIPPAYSEYVGGQLMARLTEAVPSHVVLGLVDEFGQEPRFGQLPPALATPRTEAQRG